MEISINKLLKIVNTRNSPENIQNGFFQSRSSEKYFNEMKSEIDEAEAENKNNNSIYLEDELGDILRNYLNLLKVLENEGKINLENIFSKAYNKYYERIDGRLNLIPWSETKEKQKIKNQIEHNKKYKNCSQK